MPFWRTLGVVTAYAVMVVSAESFSSPYTEIKDVEHTSSDDVTVLRERATKGDVESQFQLGSLYYHGRGVQQDYGEALRWYRGAAEHGYAKAQYNLSDMYFRGEGVAQDYSKAARWCRKAADQGYVKAQDGLAFMYYQGKGVPQDYVAAVYWARKAADQGDSVAQDQLGFMYSEGKGVGRDYREARRWYEKAAAQGNDAAKRALSSMPSASGSSARKQIRFVFLSIVFLAGLWLSTEFLWRRKSLRDWGQRATTLLGILGLAYVGLSSYGITHSEMRYSACQNVFHLLKGVVIGMAVITFIAIWAPPKKDNQNREQLGRPFGN